VGEPFVFLMEAGSDRRESLNSNQDDGFRSATRSNNRKRSEFQANQGSRDWNYQCSVGSKSGTPSLVKSPPIAWACARIGSGSA
jgi:hypothetical protein